MYSTGDGRDPHLQAHDEAPGNVGYLLFDSLVHHLIEKGVLTRNDALSVIQTVAEVIRSRLHETPSLQNEAALTILGRIYSSFGAAADAQDASRLDGHNVHPLRSRLHGDRPRFPLDDMDD